MNSPKRICVYGGTFDPAAIHHRQIGEELTRYYDLVIVVPCGPRTDKATVNDRSPIHRAISVHWTFHDLDGVEIDYSDLERDSFTPTHELVDRYQTKYPNAEIWIYVGSDNFERDGNNVSKVRRVWAQADRMLNENLFLIHMRKGYPIHPDDLPRHHQLFEFEVPGSSSEVRDLAFHRRDFEHLVIPEVFEHIRLFDVYGGRTVHKATKTFEDPRPYYLVDQNNSRALELARRVEAVIPGVTDPSQANFLSPICGDGGLLGVVPGNWFNRLPMICLNAGTVGYMLNDVPDQLSADYFTQPVNLYHFPLLHVVYTTSDGKVHQRYAVNDAVLKVGRGVGRLSVGCDGQMLIPYVSGDGLIICATIGCSAYSKGAGGPLLHLTSQDILVTGICTQNSDFGHVQIPGDTTVQVNNLNPDRWPTRLEIDNLPPVDNVVSVIVRHSRYASIQIGSLPGVGLEAKRLRHQFPQM